MCRLSFLSLLTCLLILSACGTPHGEAQISAKHCGNGTMDFATEQCDDGNTTNGDGCDSRCFAEPGYVCKKNGGCHKDLPQNILPPQTPKQPSQPVPSLGKQTTGKKAKGANKRR